MAKFFGTMGINHRLEELIKGAQERLILISPYLKLNARMKQLLEDKDRAKININVIYGKNELQPDEDKWLKSMKSIRTTFCQHLHAKCYISETQALITSMNLYEFSQVNNEEMGIWVTRSDDPELYAEIHADALRLVRFSQDVPAAPEKKASAAAVVAPEPRRPPTRAANASNGDAYCIRCSKKTVRLNPARPLCGDCFQTWSVFENWDYTENACHACGRAHATSFRRPLCSDCFRQLAPRF